MSTHLPEKENTVFERDVLFSYQGIKWGRDFDINNNTYLNMLFWKQRYLTDDVEMAFNGRRFVISLYHQ